VKKSLKKKSYDTIIKKQNLMAME